jgi:hypothetical protein
MAEEYTDSNSKTLPSYQNFSNVLFTYWQELNNATVEYRCCNNTEIYIYKKTWIRIYLKYYGEIEHKDLLGHLNIKEIKFLMKYHKNPHLITRKSANRIKSITRKLMQEFGIFDIGMGGDGEIW